MDVSGHLPPREPAAEPFWAGLAEGVLRLSGCDGCGTMACPPESDPCPRCGQPATWRDMAGTARLWSWTTFHREYFAGYPLAPPYTVLMVELTEGVRMLATLPTDIDPACLYCDQPMQFRAFELEPGASIPGFAPIS
ncbi:MAG: OB-fold domain-containing protein [Actinomycetota bacterium]|nr:OB-fold domain-containing protein [Actinomycetota bacterium]